jgi:hypothetical protein
MLLRKLMATFYWVLNVNADVNIHRVKYMGVRVVVKLAATADRILLFHVLLWMSYYARYLKGAYEFMLHFLLMSMLLRTKLASPQIRIRYWYLEVRAWTLYLLKVILQNNVLAILLRGYVHLGW